MQYSLSDAAIARYVPDKSLRSYLPSGKLPITLRFGRPNTSAAVPNNLPPFGPSSDSGASSSSQEEEVWYGEEGEQAMREQTVHQNSTRDTPMHDIPMHDAPMQEQALHKEETTPSSSRKRAKKVRFLEEGEASRKASRGTSRGGSPAKATSPARRRSPRTATPRP